MASHSRDLLLVVASLAMLSALGLVLSKGTPAEAGMRPDVEPTLEPSGAATTTEPSAGTSSPDVAKSDAVADPSPTVRSGSDALRTTGLICGDVVLAASVVPTLQHVTVVIREAVNSNAQSDRIPYEVSRTYPVHGHTPSFEFDAIPFSAYGYTVRVYAPECNGSEQVVRITKEQSVAQVKLGVTPGVPFSILLRDQLKYPVAGLEVHLIPQGEPLGRPTYQGRSADHFGAATYPNVLQGRYQVAVGSPFQPLNNECVIEVSATAGVQSAYAEVPAGMPFTVRVNGPSYGIEGANVWLLATDTTAWRKLEGKTNAMGQYTFPHVPPGCYQLNVEREGFDRTLRMVTLKEAEPRAPIDVRIEPR